VRWPIASSGARLAAAINGTSMRSHQHPRKKHWLWRAVDQAGLVLDGLVQSRRDKKAAKAKRLLRKLLKKQECAPRVLITDKPNSYAAAKREIMPGVAPVSARVSTSVPRIPTNRRDGESGS
jgi:transposase-like protein